MWSDPDEKTETWATSERGCGWYFGWKAVKQVKYFLLKQFNYNNSIDLVIRAHHLAMDGYRYSYNKDTLLTIWSAPNYYYRCGNKAAFMRVDKDLNKKIELFEADSKSTYSNGSIESVLPYFL